MLHLVAIPTYHLDWFELAEELRKVFGLADRAEIESNNDTDYLIKVEKEPFKYGEETKIAEFKKTGFIQPWHLSTLLQELANRDLIPVGHYVITVSW